MGMWFLLEGGCIGLTIITGILWFAKKRKKLPDALQLMFFAIIPLAFGSFSMVAGGFYALFGRDFTWMDGCLFFAVPVLLFAIVLGPLVYEDWKNKKKSGS